MGIYESTESRSFNAEMNKLAGTNGVTYTEQWPMHVRNGAEYMQTHYADVGRVYAEELLHNRIGTSSVLALHMDHDDLNNNQRALLTCLADTNNDIEFHQIMLACIKGNALPSTASMYFSQPTVAQRNVRYMSNDGLPPIDYHAILRNLEQAPAVVQQVQPDAVMQEAEPVVQLLVPSHEAEAQAQPVSYSTQSPPRAPAVHFNPPGSASRTVNLKGAAGKRRKTLKT